MFWYISITLKHSWKNRKVETFPVYFFFLVGQEKSSIHDFLVALKFRVPFEMCSMLGLGKEVLIVSVEGWNFCDDDSCLMKTFSVYNGNSQSSAFV